MCETRLIEWQEGFKSHGYDDANDHELCKGYTIKGNATVGFGFNIGPNGEGMSEAESRLVLNYRIGKMRSKLFDLYSWFDDLDDVRQQAIVSAVYNLGLPNFNGFHEAIRALDKGDYMAAAAQFRDSEWYRNPETRTRAGEVAGMIESGEYPPEFKG